MIHYKFSKYNYFLTVNNHQLLYNTDSDKMIIMNEALYHIYEECKKILYSCKIFIRTFLAH